MVAEIVNRRLTLTPGVPQRVEHPFNTKDVIVQVFAPNGNVLFADVNASEPKYVTVTVDEDYRDTDLLDIRIIGSCGPPVATVSDPR